MNLYDVVGLGACGVDYVTKVNSFANNEKKVTSNNLQTFDGGVTANNLVQTSKLGAKTVWCGVLGSDFAGKHVANNLTENKVLVHAKIVDKTQQCWIAVNSEGERQVYLFPNASSKLTPFHVKKHFKKIISKSKHFHTEVAVIPLCAAIQGAKIAKQNNSKVFLDIDGDINYLINEVKLGSFKELKILMGLSDVIKVSKSAANNLSRSNDLICSLNYFLSFVNQIIITLGKNGCIVSSNGITKKILPIKTKVIDSTGAGDAFMGGLSFYLLKENNFFKAAKFATACGAFACKGLGARYFGNFKDIKKLINKD